ncbi:PSD1 and planctomycete cytochrome C domain-containing protein [Dyadobacter sp. 3J3]|uniref:PSD1 and planctomycete cytochrome C domain-containing protein n=1 Tax=Dyadobacter sp. 3J3 TaxID=2606600 RepID=UPI001359F83E|nr:PSD1 and planctomycete cytochrome C domain-containing protein [Dyadobacter sp. 3J3]
MVHFPISLLCVALVLELVDWNRKSDKLRSGITIIIWIGTLSALMAVMFGWMLAGQGDYGGDSLEIHRWSGISTMVLATLALLSLKYKRLPLYRAFLIVSVLGVSFAGHYGAMLTHGDDYLSSVLPFHKNQSTPASATPDFLLANNGETLTPKQVEDLNIEVRTILAHNCYSCHGEAKTKGDLRLDSKDAMMKGGENGVVIIPNHADKSELIRRVSLPSGHKDAMPTKGKRLTEKEITLLRFWIEKGAQWPEGKMKSIYRVAALEPRTPVVPAPTANLSKPVDLFINNYFQKNKISWTNVVDDRTYIRRIYLDIIGLLPPPEKVDTFVKDPSTDKRETLAKELLNRNDDYAQHWMSFWNDVLRNDYSGTGYITGGRFDITKWLYTSLQVNKPYNWFVKELISPGKQSEGFIKGIKWRGTINSSQRTEMQAAQNVSQVFLGLNLKCASCHDSFISDWKLEQSYAFANIFADTLLEINRCDKPTGKMAGRKILFPELGEISVDANTEKRLRQLADYLVQPKDGRLYRTLVNRIWAQLLGRGIVEPVDMMDNEPWSTDLLDWLASDFAANGYDMKKLIFTIVTSKTYQLPSASVKEANDIMANNFKFTGMVRRRLTAEQFSDAISTAFNPMYADSAIVVKLLPDNTRQKLPFPRAGFVKNDAFLTSLGRPNRETVSTSRTSQANLLQALELTNGTKFTETLKRGAKEWLQKYPTSDLLVTVLYRKALGRNPVTKELVVAKKILGPNPSEESIQDLVWALTLAPDFQLIY